MENVPVHVVEYHDQVLPHWRAAGTGLTLVHVDAHHDVHDDVGGKVTIASFISRAIREGVVNRVYWVVPDPSWQYSADRQNILLQLQVLRTLRREAGAIRGGKESFDMELGGVTITTLPLRRLPRISTAAILDIDTDFLLTPRVSITSPQGNCGPPWIWPKELATIVRERVSEPKTVTVAYSVEGGFTPLMWRWLGDELVALLGNEPRDFEALRTATTALAEGDRLRARKSPQSLGDFSAAELFVRALAAAYAGEHESAARDYSLALTKDAGYRSAYVTAGFRHLWSDQPADALQCFQLALTLDKHDQFAQLGLAQSLAAMERTEEAEAAARALHANTPSLDSAILLGDLAWESRRFEEAAEAYAEALRRTLLGEHKIGEPIFSSLVTGDGIRESSHFLLHVKRGRALRAAGKIHEARQAFMMAKAVKVQDVALEMELARLFFSNRAIGQAAAAFSRGAAELARSGWFIVKRGARKAGKTLRIPLLRQRLRSAASGSKA